MGEARFAWAIRFGRRRAAMRRAARACASPVPMVASLWWSMRLPEPAERPSALLWLAAAASLLLPAGGVAVALYGIFKIINDDLYGWVWVGVGTMMLITDMVLDWAWAGPVAGKSDEPTLNRRGAELVGQIVLVVEPIEA